MRAAVVRGSVTNVERSNRGPERLRVLLPPSQIVEQCLVAWVWLLKWKYPRILPPDSLTIIDELILPFFWLQNNNVLFQLQHPNSA